MTGIDEEELLHMVIKLKKMYKMEQRTDDEKYVCDCLGYAVLEIIDKVKLSRRLVIHTTLDILYGALKHHLDKM